MKAAPPGDVLISDTGHVRTCTLARTGRRNALSLELCRNLQAAVESARSDISMIVLDHEGDTFSSGADLKEIAPFLTADGAAPATSPTLKAIWELFAVLEESDIPVVAAVTGRCLAGGLELALACDVIAATTSARFFDAHLAGGLLPSGGAAIRLPERIGRSRAFRLLVEGVEVGAAEALEWGLVDVVFGNRAELDAWLGQLGERLGGYPRAVVPSIKRMLRAPRERRDGPQFAMEVAELNAYVAGNREYLRGRLGRYAG